MTPQDNPGASESCESHCHLSVLTKLIEHEIDDAEIKRLQLTPTDQFETIQRIELPDSPVIVTEHRFRLYDEAKAAIPAQPESGSDETSVKNNGKKNWVWCISSAIMTVFHIAISRSREVLEELVGKEFRGHLNFDCFLNFDYFSAMHLQRARFVKLMREPPEI